MANVATSELGGKVMTENDILKLKRMYRCEGKGNRNENKRMCYFIII